MNRLLLPIMVGVILAFSLAWMLRGIEVNRYTYEGVEGKTVSYQVTDSSRIENLASKISESRLQVSIRQALDANFDTSASLAYDRLKMASHQDSVQNLWKSVVLNYADLSRFESVLSEFNEEDLRTVAQSKLPPIAMSSRFQGLESEGLSDAVMLASACSFIEAVMLQDRASATNRLKQHNNLCRLQFLAYAQNHGYFHMPASLQLTLGTYLGIIWSCREYPWAVELIRNSPPPTATEKELRAVVAASWLRTQMLSNNAPFNERQIFDVHKILSNDPNAPKEKLPQPLERAVKQFEETLKATERLKATIDVACEEFETFDPSKHTFEIDQQTSTEVAILRTKEFVTPYEEFSLTVGFGRQGPFIKGDLPNKTMELGANQFSIDAFRRF